jgi:peptidoglycan hydrolase-like protein with peptidoglycan-binding domain
MSGSPRDLAVLDPWEASLARSRARRERAAAKRTGGSPLRLSKLVDARNRIPSPRNLAEQEPWELSLMRSRTRRRAGELQFVPTTARARRLSLGTLIAIAAGPAAGLADANGSAKQTPAPTPEPPTTTTHYILLENGSEGRQVRLLQQALGNITVDGVFGPETEAAVRAFQASNGLTVDGIVGPMTSAALHAKTSGGALTTDIASVSPGEEAQQSAHAYTQPVEESESTAQSPVDASYVPNSNEKTATQDSPATTAQNNGSGEESETDRTGGTESQASEAKSTVSPVVRLQEKVGVAQVDGTFGPETERAVRHFQASHGLAVDGVVGPQTWHALGLEQHAVLHQSLFPHKTAPQSTPTGGTGTQTVAQTSTQTPTPVPAIGGTPVHAPGASTPAEAVRHLQEALHIQADGEFGPQTEAAVKRLQAHDGLAVDGVVGPETWHALGLSEHSTLHPDAALMPRSTVVGGGGGGGASSNTAGPGGETSSVVARVIAAANEIATRPYVYGGGHGSFQSYGYDCSGSVSYALHGGGLLSSPEDSTGLESYGEPGPGRYITIYANAEHAYMTIDGRRFDTVALQEDGSRWSSSLGDDGGGFVERHPAGL